MTAGMGASEAARPDCYACVHRRNPAGTAHSSCAHPAAGNQDSMAGIFAIFASVHRHAPVIGKGADTLGIKANRHGVANGWFNWPFDFDPVWLLACNGFTSKVPATPTPDAFTASPGVSQ